ncbi:MAG: tRNA (adenosine(37)-N6)-threonylcarbamoyltransferase complex dimerization subunit type 1 TsaB [Bacteroidetes bacterium]|nr:tRNA (adenosine(37)-N6)-threonylcarbamoyltransferase complex dimerization subunit type 1 TsaB [Bacteroidota bacterium]MCB9226035.1 tRNA (adenosine(37)-N6)-threonylcarbamoyltransferase complex dimerization subunit type 1 TsaB [Chitinophagales bacterium]
MAFFLLFDTSTKDCTVALAQDTQIISERIVENTKSHAKLLPLLFQEVLDEAKLSIQNVDAIVISEGPGSYTGLRIGFATAKALAYTLNKPIVFVDTLEAMAKYMTKIIKEEDAVYMSTMPSRKGEIYYAIANADGKIIEKSAPIFIDDLSLKFNNFKKIYYSNNDLGKKIIGNKNFFYRFVSLKSKATLLLDIDVLQKSELGDRDYIYKNPKYLKPFMG